MVFLLFPLKSIHSRIKHCSTFFNLISFGEMLIDFVPDTCVSLPESYAFTKAPGGAPANVACAVSKLGGNAAFIGKVLNYKHFPFYYHVYRLFSFSYILKMNADGS